MSNKETNHDCPECNNGTKLECDLKKGGKFYDCPKCHSCYERGEFLMALNQGRAPGKMSSAPVFEMNEQGLKQEKVKAITKECIKRTGGKISMKEAVQKLAGEGKSMSKKGTCVKCERPDMTLVSGGKCWKCYDAARKGKKPGPAKVAKPVKRKYSRKSAEPTALANSGPVERGEQPDVQHARPDVITEVLDMLVKERDRISAILNAIERAQ